jgi:dolichol-phosphate mannosyltransferase
MSRKLDISVVIPTYNERENIGRLIAEILKLPLKIGILVIDDNSPDGTGKVVDQMAREYDRVEIIHRIGKRGRGSACLAGFKRALEKEVDYIVEMDADFSHDPKELPKLVEKVGRHDVVIGSRYLKESKIVNWGFKRTLFSHLANFYIGRVLGIPINDYTNGYRCYKTKALAQLDFNLINATGYIVLSETAYQLYKKGCSFGEVPIIFINRRRGKSNLTFREIWSAFIAVLGIRWRYRNYPEYR